MWTGLHKHNKMHCKRNSVSHYFQIFNTLVKNNYFSKSKDTNKSIMSLLIEKLKSNTL